MDRGDVASNVAIRDRSDVTGREARGLVFFAVRVIDAVFGKGGRIVLVELGLVIRTAVRVGDAPGGDAISTCAQSQ